MAKTGRTAPLAPITLPRKEDTTNYAKLQLEKKDGQAFGAIYIPINQAAGIVSATITFNTK